MQSIHPETAAMSIRERMAMLELDKVTRNTPQFPANTPQFPANTPQFPTTPRLPPKPPPRPATTSNVPTKKQPPPPLPRRKTSRSSLAESVASISSTNSSGNSSFGSNTSRSLPPVYTGKESLPVQFPDKKVPTLPVKRVNSLPPPPPRNVPAVGHRPPLPTRRATTAVSQDSPRNSEEQAGAVPRRLPPLPTRPAGNVPVLPQRPGLPASHSDVSRPPPIPRSTRPPPIPVSSRPSFDSSTRTSGSPIPCLTCYDFSGPDHYASLPQFHRSRVTSVRQLARDLTEPFPSALEKARVLFVWLHHNISYDVDAFFNSNIPSQDPDSTLRSGLSVCAGYAGLFEALALHSGLEAVVVGGHGKGYGYTPHSGPPPPFSAGHAWNAVKLAPNHWHLIDACWGAGAITGPSSPGYRARFNPEQFESAPSVFGRTHFPENRAHQYREDGRVITWEEYIAPEAERPKFYGQFADLFAFSKETVVPATRRIEGGMRERFAVTLRCGHLPVIKAEDEYVLFLNVGSRFDAKNFYLMEPDGTGRGYECVVDLPREHGLKVTLYYPIEYDGRDGKGLGREYFKRRLGKCGWSWSPVAEWGGTD